MASRGLASIALIALFNAGGHCGRISPPASSSSSFWIAGYYAGWTQDACPPSAIDYSALTEVIHFSVLPNLDGTLDVAQNLTSPTSPRQSRPPTRPPFPSSSPSRPPTPSPNSTR